MTAKDRVLLVDDDSFVLQTLARMLKEDFEVHTAQTADAGLALVRESGPFAAVMADMQMPKMNGVQFLAAVRSLSPDSSRVMLTGNADSQTAMLAVNSGEVFRFLVKPCSRETLRQALGDAVQHYRSVALERDLLENTLNASIRVLSEMMSIAKPEVFGRSTRLRKLVRQIGERFPEAPGWLLDTSVMLSQLGCMQVSPAILTRVFSGASLTEEERLEYISHPQVGAELISRIPRLEEVARIVLFQHRGFDGSGFPAQGPSGKALPLGARILHVALACDDLLSQGLGSGEIVERLQAGVRCYDPEVVDALATVLGEESMDTRLRVPVAALRDGMIVQEDVRNASDVLLLCRGQEVNPSIRRLLIRHAESTGQNMTVLASNAEPRRPTH